MIRLQLVMAAMIAGTAFQSAIAQPGRGGDPSEMADRFFGMMDRNRDGRLDEEETRRIPGPMRDAMQRMGADFRRGLSRDRFGEMLPRAMEEMRRGRESGGYSGRSSGGDRGSYGGDRGSYGDRGRGDDRGDGRGPSDYRRDDGRSRDSRYGSSSRGDSRSRSSRSTPKPPPRVTVDLPEAWKVADLDKDGQIGLYEWDRKKYKEFFALDTNRDSLLTPKEISRSSGASPAPSATAVAATTIPSSRSNSTKSAKPVAATPSGTPIVAVEYDASSAEGRWAKYVFGRLDKNKDGSLSADEWNGSVKTRDSFKKHNAQMSFPANFEAFAGLMVAVQRANRKK
jgi:hypothetical protein